MIYIRFILGQMILFLDWLFPARVAIKRSTDQQKKVDGLLAHLALYQLQTCPFCVKVRRQIRRLNLEKLELRDVGTNVQYRQELETQGGMFQVPCLKISDPNTGQIQWLYESSDINTYLTQQFQ